MEKVKQGKYDEFLLEKLKLRVDALLKENEQLRFENQAIKQSHDKIKIEISRIYNSPTYLP